MNNYEDLIDQLREKRPPKTFEDGSVYDGEWIGENKDGYGIQTWPSGAKYEGEWKNNKIHGKGKQTHANSDIYEGI